ncbi:MAG: rod shape-determining protein RodA [Omnitrophica bacterium RIFCSPLOWO2_12_FULL_44_17]|uniref:Peptidoglycan glycosyltransferase RodA n=1 Tax=Candidatus Danuiimicrobium aquiferis TaxID=1801832 RepID=A0A1G1KQH9_9BACT|nr:MAG: rod shape-determining protein RodA [Omnitrophica bacterium RIFCSPHIGHO2_02_FULL_45_28]OGW88410.1 MAG: rod shape-determining protein RodA [Omnitrophica bacterium RIFCSPHIGHO2_12_FULL_44_12]OGW95200.1 MAG: rod shape-determining protein RodA [Omnitrophica bacterium RIFCSPLOWO2_12_FULL_44_17]OGX01655.1 MAG: rod shape-determining protein RodA [Omnitrophica bacterium RIFCSPLOWO2_02_FULL_44_11]
MVPRLFKEIHWPMFFVILILTGIGIASIYSATFRMQENYAVKQLGWAGIAVFVFFVTVWVGYRPFFNMSYLLYGISIVLLILVLIMGEVRSGASRWIDVGPFALQPSELAKISTIIVLADLFAGRPIFFGQKRILLLASILVLIPCVLVLKQPDLGSALVFIPMFLAIIFLWGVRIRYLVIFFIGVIASMPFAWHFLKPYQQKRILVFLDPSIDPIGVSYTAIQSKIAVGSGQIWGKGWLQGTQTHLDFVPEHHTDFIFSVIGEEFGFLGCLLLVLLFALLITYAFQIMQNTTDLRARLLATGISVILFFQVAVNIGMTIGLAPITGIPLPLVSYGGSSLVMTFFGLGLLESIYKERSIF